MAKSQFGWWYFFLGEKIYWSKTGIYPPKNRTKSVSIPPKQATAVIQIAWAYFAGEPKVVCWEILSFEAGGNRESLLQKYLPELHQDPCKAMPISGYTVMECQPYSPDMNPIERVWVHLKVKRYYPGFTNMRR